MNINFKLVKIIPLILLVWLIEFSVDVNGQLNSSIENKSATDTLQNHYSLEDIQGLWSCRVEEMHEYPPYLCTDGPYYWEFVNQSIYINGDSLWHLCFPCEVFDGYKIELSGDTIYRYGTKEQLGLISADTSKFYISDNDPFVIDWGNRPYRVDSSGTFNMQKFLHDTLNYSSLMGGLNLKTESDEPGNADPITFPVKMPLKLNIESEEEAKQICQSKEIYLKINGRKRKFYVESIDWSNDIGFPSTYSTDGSFYNPYWTCYPVIRLIPGEWWKGEPFSVGYA